MVAMNTQLEVNQAEAAATIMDGEAVMMNLTLGIYYSTDAVGARIWGLAAEGYTLDEIANQLTLEYDVTPAQAAADVQRMADQFVAEGLLRVVTLPRPSPAQPAPSTASKQPYSPPQLEIFREMGHLLALDPPMPGLENMSWNEPETKTPKNSN